MEVSREQQAIREFADARDWGRFHTPKNLAMALAGEAGELLALFQWLTPEQSSEIMDTESADHVRDELADVFIYALRLSDVLDVDLGAAVASKLKKNASRYTVHDSFGNAEKR
ncbi:nucleotide pyrophosphohydrolase [Phycicoccus sp. Root563]|uniref:nucleotide pyrophosphohydrolase n=1 Tax=Phycicoccus sp. Root563 TaxID=1736562 RepID=UPI0007024D12|nr:nucleotide pyrophosphohydrolase [Phycicoccus sp. Root563]KQZ88875.1 nucleotide pyrophosphohydrolase [Phycicoccus sp. Root563]